MPSPIIHLNVLMRVIHAIQFPISSDLVLGCISPDAIHMRPNQTWIDKATTHFYEIADDSLIDAIQTARQMLGHLSSDFRRGYLIHLYTDYLWRERIYTPYFCTYKETMIRADLHALYYRDMQRIDTVFLKDVESAIPYLKNAVSKNCAPLLTKCEVDKWRLKVLEQDLNFIKPGNNKLEVFSLVDIQLFIEECCNKIVAQFQNF